MKNLEAKTTIELEGVILTESAIKRLKAFQEKGNEDLLSMRDYIAEAICFLSTETDSLDDPRNEEIYMIMSTLGHLRQDLNDLRKP